MIPSHRYPFLPLLGALATGILCNSWQGMFWGLFYGMACCTLAIFLFTFSLPDSPQNIYRKRRFGILVDGLLLCTLFVLGSLISQVSPLPINTQSIYQTKMRCEEQLPSNNYILENQGQRFFLSRYQIKDRLMVGDSVGFQARILPIEETSNPGEFSYNHYLKQKNVHYKVIPYSTIEKAGHDRTIRSFFEDSRQILLNKTARLFPDTATYQLVSALCLGYKNDLDKNIQTMFVQTGTIHLLAVSGLHTGAIYLFLTFLLRCLRFPRHRIDLVAIPLLWGYACLTGLSPSVVRASVILTFIAFGKTFEQDYTPLNSVAASAFFTLLWQPYLIGSVSFLMSYFAYTGIVVIYPRLRVLLDHLPRYVSKPGALCGVSLAAQIPILPLTAYYFHSINLSSVFINLLAIPLATLILYVSVGLLLLPLSIGVFFAPLVTLLSKYLLGLLQIWQPFSWNITHLYPDTIYILFVYLCGVFFLVWLWKRTRISLYASVTSLCFFIIFICSHNYYLSSQQKVWVFNYHQNSVILLNYHGHYSLLQNTLPDSSLIEPYLQKSKLQPFIHHTGLLGHKLVSNNRILRTPSLDLQIIQKGENTIYPNIHTLIVTQNALPEEIFSGITHLPTQIIADGSNNHYHLRLWKDFCTLHHIAFENTTETGPVPIFLK